MIEKKENQSSDIFDNPLVQIASILLISSLVALMVGYIPTFNPGFLNLGLVLAISLLVLLGCGQFQQQERFKWMAGIVLALAIFTAGVRFASLVLSSTLLPLWYGLFLTALLSPLLVWKFTVRVSDFFENPNNRILFVPFYLTPFASALATKIREGSKFATLAIAFLLMTYMLLWAQSNSVKLIKEFKLRQRR